MYKIYKESIIYDRRKKEYKDFLINKCNKLNIINYNDNNKIEIQPILTFKRTYNDMCKIYMYLLYYLNSDSVKYIFKYIKPNEYTTQDWYMDLYDIMRCSGIYNIFHKLYKLDKPKPDFDIPWIYYDCEIISYINCFILTKINKGPLIRNKYIYNHRRSINKMIYL